MVDKTDVKEKPKIALFRALLNIAFGNVSKWKVLANPKEIVITREYNLIGMFVNPKIKMYSLKFSAGKDLMGIDPKNVEAIILGKDKLTIIGDFDVKQKTDKKDNITIS